MTPEQIEQELRYEKATGLLELAKQYDYPPEAIARQQAHCGNLKKLMHGTLEFTINGTEFIIDEFEDGWRWSSRFSDSEESFITACDVQQDSMRYVRERERKVVDEYLEDNYRAEVCQFFDRRDYP